MKTKLPIFLSMVVVAGLSGYFVDLRGVLNRGEFLMSSSKKASASRDVADTTASANVKPKKPETPNKKTLSFSSVKQLMEYYGTRDLKTDDLVGDTYILITSFPEDFHSIRPVERKKELFQKIMVPHIEWANRRITRERSRVTDLQQTLQSTGQLETDEKNFIKKRILDYEVDDDTPVDVTVKRIDELLRRLDVVPPSLILAQAANESGWGTSRFTQRANNIFGEWTYNVSEGIKPEGIDESARYRVKVFSTIQDSLQSYIKNLNTHPAYRSFRRLREKHRDSLDSIKLVQGLENYSSRGKEYVKLISSMIQSNQYRKFDDFE